MENDKVSVELSRSELWELLYLVEKKSNAIKEDIGTFTFLENELSTLNKISSILNDAYKK